MTEADRQYVLARILEEDRGYTSKCWTWTLPAKRYGYGRVYGRSGFVSAHRLSYAAFVGPIPEDRELDHLCRNRDCCNPAHLEPVTRTVNMLRAYGVKPQSDICRNGHDVRQHGRTDRGHCRICKRAASARAKQKIKERRVA